VIVLVVTDTSVKLDTSEGGPETMRVAVSLETTFSNTFCQHCISVRFIPGLTLSMVNVDTSVPFSCIGLIGTWLLMFQYTGKPGVWVQVNLAVSCVSNFKGLSTGSVGLNIIVALLLSSGTSRKSDSNLHWSV
jgi:hypothetical protein